jgi:hypothetical protein
MRRQIVFLMCRAGAVICPRPGVLPAHLPSDDNGISVLQKRRQRYSTRCALLALLGKAAEHRRSPPHLRSSPAVAPRPASLRRRPDSGRLKWVQTSGASEAASGGGGGLCLAGCFAVTASSAAHRSLTGPRSGDTDGDRWRCGLGLG